MTLQINRLSKTYPNGVKALDNLTLEINQGVPFYCAITIFFVLTFEPVSIDTM